jgi:hypothetical protein
MQATRFASHVQPAMAITILLRSQIATLKGQPSVRKVHNLTSTHMRRMISDDANMNPEYVNNYMAAKT